MTNLKKAIKDLCRRNRDGSFSTQSYREANLCLVADQLQELGFRNLELHGLKPKHVDALVEKWKAEELSSGTMKNRLSYIRWWAEKINKPSCVARDNSHYGIDKRVYVTNISKAKEPDDEKLAHISDPFVVMSLRLEALFGLRREESIKFIPSLADKDDKIVLLASWTKGGRARELPVRTDEQRKVLDEARALAKGGSLIPKHLTYVQQLKRFENLTSKVGIHNVHGFRHHYAQRRYLEITGWLPPACGGKTSKQLTAEEKILDKEARLIISLELGHEREAITSIYLGR